MHAEGLAFGRVVDHLAENDLVMVGSIALALGNRLQSLLTYSLVTLAYCKNRAYRSRLPGNLLLHHEWQDDWAQIKFP